MPWCGKLYAWWQQMCCAREAPAGQNAHTRVPPNHSIPVAISTNQQDTPPRPNLCCYVIQSCCGAARCQRRPKGRARVKETRLDDAAIRPAHSTASVHAACSTQHWSPPLLALPNLSPSEFEHSTGEQPCSCGAAPEAARTALPAYQCEKAHGHHNVLRRREPPTARI